MMANTQILLNQTVVVQTQGNIGTSIPKKSVSLGKQYLVVDFIGLTNDKKILRSPKQIQQFIQEIKLTKEQNDFLNLDRIKVKKISSRKESNLSKIKNLFNKLVFAVSSFIKKIEKKIANIFQQVHFRKDSKVGVHFDDRKHSEVGVHFNEKASVKVAFVHSGEFEKFDVSTNFSDRAEQLRQRGYIERSPEDISIRKLVSTHFETEDKPVPDFRVIGSAVTFEELKDKECVDYQQLNHASERKIFEIAAKTYGIFKDDAINGSSFIATELNKIVQELPNDKINSLETLKQALKERIKDRNVTVEEVDRELFADLVLIGSRVPFSLGIAPEFPAAKKAFNDKTWKDDEVKEIHFTEIENGKLESFMNAIDDFFADEAVIQVYNQFLNFQSEA
jgi:hypothetical protein